MSKIIKIVLEISGKEVELSVEEARELKRTLDEIFTEKKTVYLPYNQKPMPVEKPYYRPDEPLCFRPATSETWCGNQGRGGHVL